MKELVQIKNKQHSTAKLFWLLMLVFGLMAILPFLKGNPLSGIWPLAFTGIFLSVGFFITALIFRSRAHKMNHLLNGEKLLIRWELQTDSLAKYAIHQKSENLKKNKTLMLIVGIMFLLICIPFLFFLEASDWFIFTSIIAVVFLIVFFSSLFLPHYYYRRNIRGDRQVLIGAKYAYINGIFHNWDYPLSGLTKAKVMKNPFYGLNLTYYYTDRTWRHSEEIQIPAPENIELKLLISQLKTFNGK